MLRIKLTLARLIKLNLAVGGHHMATMALRRLNHIVIAVARHIMYTEPVKIQSNKVKYTYTLSPNNTNL